MNPQADIREKIVNWSVTTALDANEQVSELAEPNSFEGAKAQALEVGYTHILRETTLYDPATDEYNPVEQVVFDLAGRIVKRESFTGECARNFEAEFTVTPAQSVSGKPLHDLSSWERGQYERALKESPGREN
jgi:hypothetical protein